MKMNNPTEIPTHFNRVYSDLEAKMMAELQNGLNDLNKQYGSSGGGNHGGDDLMDKLNRIEDDIRKIVSRGLIIAGSFIVVGGGVAYGLMAQLHSVDLKTATLTEKVANIQTSVNEMKSDIKDLQTGMQEIEARDRASDEKLDAILNLLSEEKSKSSSDK